MYTMDIGGSWEVAYQSPWPAESRCSMIFEIQWMLKLREWLNTFQTCQEGWEKSYETGRTPFGKKWNKVQLFTRNSWFVTVWVAERPLRSFLTLLQHFILLTWHGSSSTVSLLLEHLLLHWHLHHSPLSSPQERIVYISIQQRPDDGFAIERNCILIPFVSEPHCKAFLHHSEDDSSDTEADSENVCIDLEQAPVWTPIYGTPHLDNNLARKPISNEYFDIFNDESDLLSPFSCEEGYGVTHWYVKHNSSRAAINDHFRNPTMETISNFTLPNTLFKWFNEMSYMMGSDSWISSTVRWNHLANPNNLCNADYTCLFYRISGEYIEFLIPQPVFREHMMQDPV